jgi:hypothetical protein
MRTKLWRIHALNACYPIAEVLGVSNEQRICENGTSRAMFQGVLADDEVVYLHEAEVMFNVQWSIFNAQFADSSNWTLNIEN